MEDINLNMKMKGLISMKKLLKWIVICDVMISFGAWCQRLGMCCGLAMLDNLDFKGEENMNYKWFIYYGNKWLRRFEKVKSIF